MAKGERDTGSKSEAIPGGTKASDLPASVGGTKGTEGTTPGNGGSTARENLADAQATAATDAGQTRAAPTSAPGVTGVPETTRRGTVPVRDETRATRGNPHLRDDEAEDDEDRVQIRRMISESSPSQLALLRSELAGGAADETTVAQFIDMNKVFIVNIKNGNWSAAFKAGGDIVKIFADLMDTGGFHLFGTTGADAAALADVDAVGRQLRQLRADVSPVTSSSRALAWDGSDRPQDTLSGSPAPLAAAQAPADPKGLDPASILVIIELVSKAWEMFKKFRNR